MVVKEESSKNTFALERLIGLSDGVIVIALTLLVLAIDIPTEHNFSKDGLTFFLLKLEPSIIAYASSFIVVAIYWMQHRAIYGSLKLANSTFLWFNLAFLFTISLAPFASKLKTLYHDDLEIVFLFSVMHIVSGMILLLMWRYAIKHKELQIRPISPAKSKNVTLSILLVPIVCVVAFFLSLFNVDLGTHFFIVIPFIFIFRKQFDD